MPSRSIYDTAYGVYLRRNLKSQSFAMPPYMVAQPTLNFASSGRNRDNPDEDPIP
jgi:hypothetical protein